MKRKPMWEIKQSAEAETLDLYIYGEVEKKTFVDDDFLGHYEQSENSADHFREELAKYPDVKNINLFINSKGGDVIEGTAILNQLKRHPAYKTVYVDGFACSIAAMMMAAGDEVVMYRNSMVMIHDMYMKVIGNPSELRKFADDLEKINQAGRTALLDKSGGKLTEQQLDEMMKAETWLTAEECLKYGLADRIADQAADMSEAAEVLQNASMTLEQRIRFHRGLAAQLRELTEPKDAIPDVLLDANAFAQKVKSSGSIKGLLGRK